MPRFNDKWLPLILALLLGAVPFARGYADTFPIEHNTAAGAHDAIHHAVIDENVCDECTASHSCGTSSCTCYQCGTCSVTLLHEPLIVPHATLSPLIPSSGIGSLTTYPFLLFRPPRA